MKVKVGDRVVVRNIQNTTDRIHVPSNQKNLIAARGVVTGNLEDGFFNVQHRQGYFVWHESSLGTDYVTP